MNQQLKDDIERYVGGGMNDDESRAFLQAIRGDAQALAYLQEVLTQQAMLFELHRAGVLQPVPAAAPKKQSGSAFRLLAWSATLAACVLAGITVFIMQEKPQPSAPASAPVEVAGMGHVTYVAAAGDASRTVLVRGSAAAEALREGQEVRSGDVIRTDATGGDSKALAGIALWNGATLELGRATHVALQDSDKGRRVKLLQGQVYTEISAASVSANAVRIQTDFADMELGAGRFDVFVDKTSTRLRVEEGQGFIFNELGRTIVRKFEESMAQQSAAPNGPIAIIASVLWRGHNGTLTLPKSTAANTANVGVVSHIKLLSDKVDDLSSFEAWRATVIKPEMTDRERALAVFDTAVKYMMADSPPAEYLSWDGGMVADPIKMFNVYGYGAGPSGIANVVGLARNAGMAARGWAGPNVAEIQWAGHWHAFDPLYVSYFPKPDGDLASVDELTADVTAWYAANPSYKDNEKALREFMVNEGWKKGPSILAMCPFLDRNGWLPTGNQGWYSHMRYYTGVLPDGTPSRPFESGYSTGYQVNIQLREGERITRNWSNIGLHVGSVWGDPVALKPLGPKSWVRQYGDLAPGRVGNGTLEYSVPLAGSAARLGALQYDNLAGKAEDGKTPALHVKDGAQPATLVLRMPSSYVYLDGRVDVTTVVAPGGRVVASISCNNGLDWKTIDTATSSGRHQIDLKQHIFRRYDYRLKFEFEGEGSGLDALSISNAIQHSQRALPILGKGRNTISFSSSDAEGTVTIEGSTRRENSDKQLVYTDFHPSIDKIEKAALMVSGLKGQITFPIETPGDMTRLRIGCHYRARDARDGWELSASFDGGKTFKTIDRLWGPVTANSTGIKYTEIPQGSRSALVRLFGVQRTTTLMFDLRIDADYKEPAGGFRPVKITYLWDEDGVAKSDVHIATTADESYEINCNGTPAMKSVVLELAE